MGDADFAKVHNSSIFLEDPPIAHVDMKFIVDGFKKSCLVHALTISPAIYQNLIREFRQFVVVKKNNKGEKFIEATMENKQIHIREVLDHIGYEGTFPPTIKKLLPPCMKYPAHIFVSCIFGRRSGANEISLVNTGAIAALAAGYDFNFSKFILNEMILNLEGNKRDKFMMYPRLVQIILNVTHPKLQRGNEVLDLKSIGPNAFGLMKQKRTGKFVFEGKFPLIKFGIFEERDKEESEEHPVLVESEDTHHSGSEPEIEVIFDSPMAFVAEEHDFQKSSGSKSTQEDDDESLYNDVDFLKAIDFTGIGDHIPTNIEFDLSDEDCGMFPETLNNCANKADEAASSAAKARDEGSNLKILLSCSKPLDNTSSQADTSSKSSQPLASLEVPVTKSAPQVLSTITTTIQSYPLPSQEGPSTNFETGGSSSIPEYSPTRPSMDEASIRLAKHLAQIDTVPSHGKGISFREGQSHSDDDDFPLDPPAPRKTIVINRFEKEPEGSEARVTAKQGKRIISEGQREGLLFMKNSNENRRAKDPVLIVTDLKKQKFGDMYGDR
ncbi:unnamed protein product [Lactuca saligna]|uniref:Uncharacterized protein n=1 Tax=Lactuca saligna TaxID=75948 RepID=A0AA35V9N7_LACSI|nr:unnamed protein product [Lactuca saligna]